MPGNAPQSAVDHRPFPPGVHGSAIFLGYISIFAGWFAIVVGDLVLLGWATDSAVLKGEIFRDVTMKPNAAICLILSGVSLLLLRSAQAGWARRVAGRILALVCGLLALAVLSQYVVGWNLGIDQLLFHEAPGAVATTAPGRMGVLGSVSFIVSALALLAIGERTRLMCVVAQYLAAINAAVLLVPLAGYLYGVQAFYGLTLSTAIAAHTAVALIALDVGIFFAQPRCGPAAVFSSGFAGGVMARKFFLPALLGSLVIGWLCVLGIRGKHFDPYFAIALLLVSLLILHGLLIRRTAGVLNAIDESLRRGEERYRSLVEASAQVVWSTDPDGENILISRGNEPARRAEAPLEDFYGRIHPDDRGRVTSAWETSLRTREVYRAEYRIRQPDGQYRFMADAGVPVRNSDGSVREWIGVTADITERKRAEEALRELSETLEHRVQERTAQLRALAAELTQTEARERRRLAQVLHDHLQQLLVVAKMRLSMLRGAAAATELSGPLREVEEAISESIQASRSLTLELSPPILYDGGLAQALDWLARRMHELHQLAVEVDADPDAEPDGEAIKALLFQAVSELLFNVVKHAETHEARVTMEREDSRIAIRVEDSGNGFDPKIVTTNDLLSDHFGLFSIRERLALLGGDMVIDSSPGEGTCISLSAPLTTEPVRSPARASNVSLPAPTIASADRGAALPDTVRVLLADDHRILREGVAGLLREQPFIEVIGQAEDGQMALEMARELRPDVVVMDVTMPRLNGVEATRAIRQELPNVQVIGLSMHEKEDMAEAMRDAGAFAYLPKGGPAERLVAAIRSCARSTEPSVPTV